MIDPGQRIIERAFELAKSGKCKSIQDIRVQLRFERYDQVDAHLAGAGIKKQLTTLIDGASI